jgi:hypothetical protein
LLSLPRDQLNAGIGQADAVPVEKEKRLAVEGGGEQQQGAVAQAGEVARAASGHAGELGWAGRRGAAGGRPGSGSRVWLGALRRAGDLQHGLHGGVVAGRGVAGAAVPVVQGGGVPGQRAGGDAAGQGCHIGRGACGAGRQRGPPQGSAPRLERRPVASIDAPGLRRLRRGCARGVTALPWRASVHLKVFRPLGGRGCFPAGRDQAPWSPGVDAPLTLVPWPTNTVPSASCLPTHCPIGTF